jgi:hypothetical protein
MDFFPLLTEAHNESLLSTDGVCEMMREKFDAAKFMFTNALEIDATLFEAIYNMGETMRLSTRSFPALVTS